ncbi:carbohydrate binding family 9 domain-containing protein [Candidatus Poribacteria bacterium]|nr:carbohydrate binding family 9 domain-containing protein [Candidatus Poribacteria bacterium]
MGKWIGRISLWVLICLTPISTLAGEGYRNRRIQAVKTDQPPVIDGKLDDLCWKKAPLAHPFIDSYTSKVAPDQTEAYVLYDEKALYVAFKCFDSQPDQIKATETKRDGNPWGDDFVEVAIDPFDIGQFSGRNVFKVNAIGTQFTEIRGGRANKAEWKGDWQAAVRRTEFGWTAEMAIPWDIMDRPSSDKPITMGINFGRYQARTKIFSFWSDLGYPFHHEWNGHLVGVILPKRKPKRLVRILGYTFGGIKPDRRMLRGGLNLRYRPSGQANVLLTINPDFSNVEQEVETIDFSYLPRAYSDKRPFFQEGREVFGGKQEIFYSRRIIWMDGGVKGYGRKGRWTFGVMDCFDLDRWNAFLMRVSREVGEAGSISFSMASHLDSEEGYNQTTYLAYNGRFGDMIMGFDIGASLTEGEGGEGSFGSGYVGWRGRNLFANLTGRYISPGYETRLGFAPSEPCKGIGFNLGYSAERLMEGKLSMGVGILANDYNHYEGGDYRSRISPWFWTWFSEGTRWGFGTHLQFERSRFEEFEDTVLSGGVNLWRRYDLFEISGGLSLSLGTRREESYRFIKPSLKVTSKGNVLVFNYYIEALKLGKKREKLHVLWINFNITPERSLGGRMVLKGDKLNWYLSYRQGVRRGMDVYFIMGDPNAEEFSRRAVLKLIIPLK